MKNLHPNCENPAIILNPNLKDLILKYQNYHFNGKDFRVPQYSKWYMEFPYRTFYQMKYILTHDLTSKCQEGEKRPQLPFELIDFDSAYIITDNGEREPLFLPVPCGKCVLCTDKKANEWVTRAACESQTSISQPLFITLTYNDNCMPSNGVRKSACQRFMKRLRINVERYVGRKCNIRFFMCAEYGSKTGRPHYHAILWNMPLLDIKHTVDLVQKSWSVQVSETFYNKLPNTLDKFGQPIFKYIDPFTQNHRMLFGYTTTYLCNDGGARYCMKYMRKESKVPEGKNSLFFLASRRGGIGSAWIKKKLEEYRNNPSILDVQFIDIWTGNKFCGCLPSYFKYKISPCNSIIIKKDMRDNFKLWNYLCNKVNTITQHFHTPNPRIIEHYPTMYYHHAPVYDRIEIYELKSRDDTDRYTRMLSEAIQDLEQTLLSYDYDVKLARSAPLYKQKHMESVERFIASLPHESIIDKVARIRRMRKRTEVSANPYL